MAEPLPGVPVAVGVAISVNSCSYHFEFVVSKYLMYIYVCMHA